MGSNTSSRRSQSLQFPPGGADYAEQAYGAAGAQLGQYGFARQPYTGTLGPTFTPEQAGAFGQVREQILGVTDVGAYANASRASLRQYMQDVLGPEMRSGALGEHGYGSEALRSMALGGGLYGMQLESDIARLGIGSEDAARERALQYGSNLPAFLAGADPEQYSQQLRDLAQYQEFLSQNDPAWMQMMLGAIPGGTPLSSSTANRPGAWETFLTGAAGGAGENLGSAIQWGT